MHRHKILKTLIFCFFFGGCSTLAEKEVVVGCQTADAVTTIYAMHHGAVELNPIPFPLLMALKVFIIVWALKHTEEEWEKEDKGARAVIAVAGCAPAVNNLNVIRSLKK